MEFLKKGEIATNHGIFFEKTAEHLENCLEWREVLEKPIKTIKEAGKF